MTDNGPKIYQASVSGTSSEIHPTAQIFNKAKIVRAKIGRNAIVGDYSRVIGSTLGELAKVDRYNLVQGSKIGRLTYTGMSTIIQSAEIGSFGSISHRVYIGGADHDYTRLSTHDFFYNARYGIAQNETEASHRYKSHCRIGHDVWIGGNATVLRGVTIENGAVIGAGAVVSRDVPAYAIAVGNPARVTKYRFEPEIIHRLQELRWWNFELEQIMQAADQFKSGHTASALDELEKLL